MTCFGDVTAGIKHILYTTLVISVQFRVRAYSRSVSGTHFVSDRQVAIESVIVTRIIVGATS
jgi:hypothetical protein